MFSKDDAESNFNSFRVASSLESLKTPSTAHDEDEEENPAYKLNENSELPLITELCSRFINKFEQDLSGYHHLISIINVIGGSMTTGALEGYVLPQAKTHGTKIESDSLKEIYGLSESGSEIVFEHVRRMNEINQGLLALPSSLLLSLVASFDSLIGDFINEILKAEPTKVKFSEKTITYRELFQVSDVSKILNDAINSEISQLLRGSHLEQIEYIEKLIDTKIVSHYERLPNYLEIFERRNQIAHAAGIVTERYLEKCKTFKYPVDGLVVGERLKLAPQYLHKAVDYLAEFGITFAFMTWRKLGEKPAEAFAKLNQVCFELIVKRRYRLAGHLLDFALHKQTCDADDVTKRMMQVNLANSYARAGKPELAEKTLSELDWSACSDQFKICVAAVKDDIEQVCKILPQAVSSGSISKSALRTWPVFDGIKESKEFALAFENAFMEPYKIELVAANPADNIESLTASEDAFAFSSLETDNSGPEVKGSAKNSGKNNLH